jgi:predicted transcriptional regulator
MRKAFTITDNYENELRNDANALVISLNNKLRHELSTQLTQGKVTMIALEKLALIPHATLFQWYKGINTAKVDTLYRIAYVLRTNLTII